jgi:putative flippase GtrA
MIWLRRLQGALGKQFLQFALIGGLATFVDLGALWVALHLFQWGPYVGRVFSFLCAASFTWFLNRTFTFKGIRNLPIVVEYFRFLGVAIVGGTVNFAIYSLVIYAGPKVLTLSPDLKTALPYLGVILGSGGGLFFNFTGSRLAVFRDGGATARSENR